MKQLNETYKTFSQIPIASLGYAMFFSQFSKKKTLQSQFFLNIIHVLSNEYFFVFFIGVLKPVTSNMLLFYHLSI